MVDMRIIACYILSFFALLSSEAFAQFTCAESSFYMVTAPTGADPVQLSQINFSTSPATLDSIGPQSALQYNGIAYNPVDNFIYGIVGDTGMVVRLGADGIPLSLGVPVAGGVPWPGGTKWETGTVLGDGTFLVARNVNGGDIAVLDVLTNPAGPPITVSASNLPGGMRFPDFAYDSNTDGIFGFETNAQRLGSIDLSGAVSLFGVQAPGVSAGSAFFNQTGDLILYARTSPGQPQDTFFIVPAEDLDPPSATAALQLHNTGPPGQVADGAACANPLAVELMYFSVDER